METIIDQLAKIEEEAIATIEEAKKRKKELAIAHKKRMDEYDINAEAKKQEQIEQMKRDLRKELEKEHELEEKKDEKELELLIDYYENHIEERVNEILSEKRM